MHWKFELLNRLRRKGVPRVLTADQFHELVVAECPGAPMAVAQVALDDFVQVSALRRVNDNLYLNMRALPPVRSQEAARQLHPDAVVSLRYVLGEVGAINNPTEVITAVIPATPARTVPAEHVPPLPEHGVTTTNGGVRFEFYVLDERFFPVSTDDDQVIARGAHSPRATPEAALLHWIQLAKLGALTRPPPGDIEFEPDTSLAHVCLSRSRYLALAKRWRMQAEAEAWLALNDYAHLHEDDHNGMPIDANPLDSLTARDGRVLAIRFLRSKETMGSLMLRCKGDTPEAQEARFELACVLLMVKQDAPEDLRMTDAQLYRRLRDRITELRMAGWLEKHG